MTGLLELTIRTRLQTDLVLTGLIEELNSYYHVFHIKDDYSYLRRYYVYIYEHELVGRKEEILPYLVLKQKKLELYFYKYHYLNTSDTFYQY